MRPVTTMYKVTKTLAEYAQAIDFSKVPPETRHEVKRRVIDSLAVAFAAYTAEPVAIARRVASKFPVAKGARIIGTRYQVSPDWATFVNGLVIFPVTALRVAMYAIREVFKTILREGTQASWLDKMFTRKELYELIKYYDYERIDGEISSYIDNIYKKSRGQRHG